MKTYQETYYTISESAADGLKSERVLPEAKAQKVIEEAKKAGNAEPEVLRMQSFTVYEAEAPADFAALVPDETQQVNLFNRGLVLKEQGFIRDVLTDSEFQPTDGAYDLREACAEVRERRKATPAEKAVKQLAGLSQEDLAAVLKQFGIDMSAVAGG